MKALTLPRSVDRTRQSNRRQAEPAAQRAISNELGRELRLGRWRIRTRDTRCRSGLDGRNDGTPGRSALIDARNGINAEHHRARGKHLATRRHRRRVTRLVVCRTRMHVGRSSMRRSVMRKRARLRMLTVIGARAICPSRVQVQHGESERERDDPPKGHVRLPACGVKKAWCLSARMRPRRG